MSDASTSIVDADFRGLTNFDTFEFKASEVSATAIGAKFDTAGFTKMDYNGATSVALTASGIGTADAILGIDNYSANVAGTTFAFGGTDAASDADLSGDSFSVTNGVYTKDGATVSDFYTAIAAAAAAGDVAAFVDSGNTYLFAEGAATGATDDSFVVLNGFVATAVSTTHGAASVHLA